jgi:hypothetical protein
LAKCEFHPRHETDRLAIARSEKDKKATAVKKKVRVKPTLQLNEAITNANWGTRSVGNSQLKLQFVTGTKSSYLLHLL